MLHGRSISAAVVMLLRATGSDKPYDYSRSAMSNDTYSIEGKGKRFLTAILRCETFHVSYVFQSIAKLLSHNNGHYRHCRISASTWCHRTYSFRHAGVSLGQY